MFTHVLERRKELLALDEKRLKLTRDLWDRHLPHAGG
jgi:hypothetical protein